MNAGRTYRFVGLDLNGSNARRFWEERKHNTERCHFDSCIAFGHAKILGLPPTADAMAKLPKSYSRKVVVAVLLRERTSVGNSWIAKRLAMGHSGSVSRMIGSCLTSGESVSTRKQLANALDDEEKEINM
jgi:hypothetical protein